MSISLVLIPLAIALAITAKETIGEKLVQKNGQLSPIQTIFHDHLLLEKTLREHGLAVTVCSEDRLVCQAGKMQLSYVRQKAGEPFYATVSGVKDINQFLKEMDCFDREYRQNVQSYTYHKLMEGLAENNMKVAEEAVLEDNSILLTIDI